MCISTDPLTDVSIAELWQRSGGISSRRVNRAQSLKSSPRRTIRTRLPLGGRTSRRSFMSSMYVQSALLGIHGLAASSQTELAITTYWMAEDIDRNLLMGQDVTPGRNPSVGAICHPLTTECLPSPRLNQASDAECYGVCALCFRKTSDRSMRMQTMVRFSSSLPASHTLFSYQ